jgi:hypothetical protein
VVRDPVGFSSQKTALPIKLMRGYYCLIPPLN